MSSLGDQSEKKKYNKSSETVPLAQHEILKGKYESLEREHETLIKALELLEEDLVKNQRESLVMKEDIVKLVNTIGEMQKKQEMLDKDIEDLMSIDETEMNGMDSSSARFAEKPKVNNIVSNEDVIEISDDDEGNQRESNRGHSCSRPQNRELSFKL